VCASLHIRVNLSGINKGFTCCLAQTYILDSIQLFILFLKQNTFMKI